MGLDNCLNIITRCNASLYVISLHVVRFSFQLQYHSELLFKQVLQMSEAEYVDSIYGVSVV